VKGTIDAISNDVSAEDLAADELEQHEDKPAAKREPSERDKALAEIARLNDERNGIKRDDSEDDEGDNEQEALADESAGDEEVKQEKPAAQGDPLSELGYYRNKAGELVTKMKINGEEREVKADQVKAFIQKDLAGDTKLQQASERERRLQERENLLSTREQEMKKALTKQPSEQDAADTLQRAKGALEKLWDGDTDAAAQALADLLQRGNTTALTPEQLESMMEKSSLTVLQRESAKKTQEEWNSSVDDGNRFLSEKHPEIYNDQRLFDLVNSETARIVEAQERGDPQFQNLTPKQIIEKAATDVSGWMGKRDKPNDGQQSRTDRKAGLKIVPKGMGATQSRKPAQELDMSPKAVIARMRAGRAS